MAKFTHQTMIIGKPVTAEDRAMMASMYQRGHTFKEIARRCDRPNGTVAKNISDMLRRGDLKYRSHGPLRRLVEEGPEDGGQ